ncbi:phosphotransferase family protein [Roseibium salinum]|nr:phosphotransferase family protein [Roseibium salinum]
MKKFERGQSNPTYRLLAGSGDYVLRRKPPGALLKSAHAVDREFRVQKALAGSDVPVAGMHVLCEDETVIGSAFYVMERIAGRNFDDPRLPDIDPATRAGIYAEMNRVLAAIHLIDLKARGLSDFGPAGNYYRRQIDRWSKQYRASETEVIPAMDELIAWLDANVPEDDGRRTLVHGDYRIDNLLFAEDGARCVAVLDWELSTLGHPFADLAALIMQWQRPPGPEGRGLAGVDRKAFGIPDDQAFIDSYCERTGIGGISDFGFLSGLLLLPHGRNPARRQEARPGRQCFKSGARTAARRHRAGLCRGWSRGRPVLRADGSRVKGVRALAGPWAKRRSGRA